MCSVCDGCYIYLSIYLPLLLNIIRGLQEGIPYTKDKRSVWGEFVQCENIVNIVKR